MTRESQVSKLARDSYESSACSRDQWTIRCKLEQSYTDERRKNLAGKEERPRVVTMLFRGFPTIIIANSHRDSKVSKM